MGVSRSIFTFFSGLLILIGCSQTTQSQSERSPEQFDSSQSEAEPDSTQMPEKRAFLTIDFAETEKCPGGRFFIDGLDQGSFPVKSHPVEVGRHTVKVQSRSDCAGTPMSKELDFIAGSEHRIELDPLPEQVSPESPERVADGGGAEGVIVINQRQTNAKMFIGGEEVQPGEVIKLNIKRTPVTVRLVPLNSEKTKNP